MKPQQIAKIIHDNQLWLQDPTKGAQADFSNSKLQGVNLSGLNLRKAIFRGANLTDAAFRDCDLRDTDFSGCIIRGVDFIGSDLDGADMRRVQAARNRPGKRLRLTRAQIY